MMKQAREHRSWPDEVELEVSGIAQGGDGVGRWQGRAVFAASGLPGEVVRVRLVERRAAFARGVVEDVLTPAPERRVSPCPLEASCGAADWRWIDYEAQLRFKATILREQLQHLGSVEVEVVDVHGMPTTAIGELDVTAGAGWAYRTTAELHVDGGKLGYYSPGSRRVMDTPRCCLHHPLINDALMSLRPLLPTAPTLRGVTIRCAPGSGETLAILDGDDQYADLARSWSAVQPSLVGVVQRQGAHLRTLHGRDYLIHEIDGIRWQVSAGSFFQNNDVQTGRLIERVCDLVAPTNGQRLLDLFCGVGTFALPLARMGAEVVGVESYAPAIADARRNTTLNRLKRVSWRVGPVERVLQDLLGPFDGAVLDPPRRGCAPAALQALLRLQPARIVYVSCHPGTLARDCKILRAGGYRIERAEVIDMFPQTNHVESIVTLGRL